MVKPLPPLTTLRPVLACCLVAAGLSAGSAMAAVKAPDCSPSAAKTISPAAEKASGGRSAGSRKQATNASRALKPAPRPLAASSAGTGASTTEATPQSAAGKPSSHKPTAKATAKPRAATMRAAQSGATKAARSCGPGASESLKEALAPETGEAPSSSRSTPRASLLRAAGMSEASADAMDRTDPADTDPLAGIWTGLPGERGPIASGPSTGWGAIGGIIETSLPRWPAGGDGGRAGMGGGLSGAGSYAEMTSGRPPTYSHGGGDGGERHDTDAPGDRSDLRPKSEHEPLSGHDLPHTDVPVPSSIWLLLAGLPIALRKRIAGARTPVLDQD